MPRPIHTITIVALFVAAVSMPSGSLTAQGRPPERGQGRGNAPAAERTSGLYIVHVADLPVADYRGGIAGLAATKPGRGRKVNAADPAVVDYARYLDTRHDQVLADMGVSITLVGFGAGHGGLAVVEDQPVRQVQMAAWLVTRLATQPEPRTAPAVPAPLVELHQ